MPSAEARAGEVADRLDPELVEPHLVLAQPPPPRFVEAEEHDTPGADELLHDQRFAADPGAAEATPLDTVGVNGSLISSIK